MSETQYKKLASHEEEDDDVEVQKTGVKLLLSEENNGSVVSSSYATAAFIGAFLGLVLCGLPGMLIGFALGYSFSKCGACKCLMITASVLFAISFILLVAFFAVGYFYIKEGVEHLTVTEPSPKFPVIKMTDSELEAVQTRVASFVDELLNPTGGPIDDLIVTQDEINGFIGHSDYLRGNAMVTLHPGSIEENYSLPTDMLPGGKDRYFVGSDYMKIDKKEKADDDEEDDAIVDNSIEMKMETAAKHQDWFDGPLFFTQLQYLVTKNKEDEGKAISELFLKHGNFFGYQVPEQYIKEHENLFQYICQDGSDGCKEAEALFEGIEEIVIEEGKIIVKPLELN